ncbi:RNA-binding protein [Pararhizobium mangrovi]|uniref:RNA-binding protein n=1 Tax=Pararhizobium mangrovi TaxID=2590452 RepID=A0A506TVK3_9HYPH|nr:RNA-binding protein [Pararhizobium mangrovi]TPW26112.1 RNA-binding protein [Pararhizobium mangrovi]
MSGYREPMNARTCIVTREHGEPDELLRFVAGPEQRVVCDLKRDLPGRGCWVTPERACVEKAAKRKLFARGLKAPVTAPDDLADEVDRLMLADLVSMMSMARKAGQFVAGAGKVDGAVRGGRALAVFHATEAAADGMRKIDQARHARQVETNAQRPIPAFRLASGEEMAKALGDGAFIHCVALAGKAGEGVVKRATRLERYRNGRS